MPGRPRLYQNAAEKTRAYRKRQERTVSLDRITFEQIDQKLEQLMEAVHLAQQAGDPLAGSLTTLSRLDLLADLAAYFEARGAERRQESW